MAGRLKRHKRENTSVLWTHDVSTMCKNLFRHHGIFVPISFLTFFLMGSSPLFVFSSEGQLSDRGHPVSPMTLNVSSAEMLNDHELSYTHTTIQLHVVNRPLIEVLGTIQHHSGIVIEILPSLKDIPISKHIDASSWSQLLHELLPGYDRLEQYDRAQQLTHMTVAERSMRDSDTLSHDPDAAGIPNFRSPQLADNTSQQVVKNSHHQDNDHTLDTTSYHIQDLRTSSDQTLRAQAFRALTQAGDTDQAINAISISLFDEHPQASNEAIDLLADMGWENEEIQKLLSLVQRGDEAGLRERLTATFGQ